MKDVTGVFQNVCLHHRLPGVQLHSNITSFRRKMFCSYKKGGGRPIRRGVTTAENLLKLHDSHHCQNYQNIRFDRFDSIFVCEHQRDVTAPVCWASGQMFESLFCNSQNANGPIIEDDLTENFFDCTQIDWTLFLPLKPKIAHALPEMLKCQCE